ncbi:hypothetical protein [Lentzea sp. NPDC060358]|uniref:hypothetical protein n=1 Tax=Lentzea sp. NPDC060358 TaxID=3347103 RepID=UPI0036483E0B
MPRSAGLSVSPDIVDALRNRPALGSHPGDVVTITRLAASGPVVRGAVRITASTTAAPAHVRQT